MRSHVCLIASYLKWAWDFHQTMWSQICLIASCLKWAWDFLLRYSFFQSHRPLGFPQIGEEPRSSYYYGCNASPSSSDCAVCLCKIEQGEEVPQLRCNHLFHPECLDKWVGYRHATCPLCRDILPPLRPITELEAEVLVFNFRSFGSRGHRDAFWLR